MSSHDDLIATVQAGSGQEFQLNIIIREVTEEDGRYFVAQCLELPGCVADGDSVEEARANFDVAVRDCLAVVIEDCLQQLLSRRTVPELTHVVRQDVMRVAAPELEYA